MGVYGGFQFNCNAPVHVPSEFTGEKITETHEMELFFSVFSNQISTLKTLNVVVDSKNGRKFNRSGSLI